MRLPGTLFSYAGGLLTAPYLHLPPALPILILVATGAWALSSTRATTNSDSTRLSTLCLIICFFSIGLFQYQITVSPPINSSAIHHLGGQGPVILEGNIESMNTRFPDGATCLISVTSSLAQGVTTKRSGKLLLKIEQLTDKLQPGDLIRFRTRLRVPRAFGAPGEFNYQRHLAHQAVFVTGFVHSSNDIVRLESSAIQMPGTILRHWRQQVGDIINASVPAHLAPFLRGLATGDRGALSPEQRKFLAQSGIAHLFAISGLHLGIIASFLYILLLTIYRQVPWLLQKAPPRRFLPAVILPVVAAYMLFTGGAISTLRALLGLAAVTAAFLLRRQIAPLHLLATAALVMLLLDPLAVFTPAFQLSFAGAAGILCITPRWTAICQGRSRLFVYPATLLVVTLAATTATLLLVLLHFHVLAPAGLLLNMIAVPAVTLLAVPLCLAGVVAAVFSPTIAAVLFNLAATVLDHILNASEAVLALPGFSGQYLYLPFSALLGVGLLILALLAPATIRFRIAGLLIAIALLSAPFMYNQNSDRLSIVAISVGQGDATLVTTSTGKTILIDGGGFSQSSYDTGERLVAPTLGYLGIRTIDAVLLSHNHPDHRNGLQHILQRFNVRNFWSPVNIKKLPTSFQSTLADRHIKVRTFAENWSIIEQTANSKIAIYRVPGRPESTNDQSMVLYVQHGNDGVLLTGDLETMGINQLALDPPPGPVTLLKFPHHGSRFSNPLPLVKQYNPQAAYISVGYNNRYGQPHASVLSLLDNYPLQLERTDLSGSLYFSSTGKTWSTRRWRQGLFR